MIALVANRLADRHDHAIHWRQEVRHRRPWASAGDYFAAFPTSDAASRKAIDVELRRQGLWSCAAIMHGSKLSVALWGVISTYEGASEVLTRAQRITSICGYSERRAIWRKSTTLTRPYSSFRLSKSLANFSQTKNPLHVIYPGEMRSSVTRALSFRVARIEAEQSVPPLPIGG